MDFVPSADALLAEIEVESLQSLLTSVHSFPLGYTGISSLDTQLSQPLRSTFSVDRGDVIEIQGPPGSGKTHLLYHLLINCILPSKIMTAVTGGWEKVAVIFDADNSLHLARLYQLLLARLSRLLAQVSLESSDYTLEHTARECMKKLHIFRPTSSAQLAATIINLPAYHVSHLPDTEIGLLAVDSISAFYWPDRLTVEQMRGTDYDRPARHPLQHVLTALQKFRTTHSPLTILTNWGLNTDTQLNSATGSSHFYRQHLHPFPMISDAHYGRAPSDSMPTPSLDILSLTHHITLIHSSISSVREDASLEEALEEDQKNRLKILEKGEVAGILRTSGSSQMRQFTFRIDGSEILQSNPIRQACVK